MRPWLPYRTGFCSLLGRQRVFFCHTNPHRVRGRLCLFLHHANPHSVRSRWCFFYYTNPHRARSLWSRGCPCVDRPAPFWLLQILLVVVRKPQGLAVGP